MFLQTDDLNRLPNRWQQECHQFRAPFRDSNSPLPHSTQTLTNISDLDADLPALIHTRHNKLFQPRHNIRQYLRLELDVTRLNVIHKHLWLAGLPTGARALHRQKLLDRSIVVTEQADLHLVWYQDRIFVKPLPTFLLRPSTWTEHLCRSPDLHAAACGFLLSYAWLVCHPSDFRLARELGLLPADVNWERWTAFVADVLDHIHPGGASAGAAAAAEGVSARYEYGELRLSRLNWIHRFSAPWTNGRAFLRGYHQGPRWYSLFVRRNFGWLVVVFAYMAIVLSAMQVGLATERLGGSAGFQRASYGFAVFAIVVPVFGVLFLLVASAAISVYYVVATLRYHGQLRGELREI